MSSRLEGVAWACIVILMGAAVYQALVATELLPIGDEPGSGAPGSGLVLGASLLAFLVGSGAALFNAARSDARRSLAWAALAPAGAVVLVARWFSFDPYYAPALRRFSEGAIAGQWVAAVLLAALGVGVLGWLLVRVGSLATALVLLLEALTAWILPFGK